MNGSGSGTFSQIGFLSSGGPECSQPSLSSSIVEVYEQYEIQSNLIFVPSARGRVLIPLLLPPPPPPPPPLPFGEG